MITKDNAVGWKFYFRRLGENPGRYYFPQMRFFMPHYIWLDITNKIWN